MPRRPLVPLALTTHAFDLVEARAHGLTKDHLRASCWRRIGRELYAWHEIAEEPLVRLAAIKLPAGAAFSGRTAAWLHGFEDRLREPIEVTGSISRMAGIVVHRSQLLPGEVWLRRGLPTTSPLRTIVDLARQLPVVEAVVLTDAALHRRAVSPALLTDWIGRHPGFWGIARVRGVANFAEPATESPMETRLRMALVLAGLPRPQVQVTLRNARGAFIGRPDLYYRLERVAIEYDGLTHKDSLAADDRRQNRFVNAGIRLLRFTAADVLGAPGPLVALVQAALAA